MIYTPLTKKAMEICCKAHEGQLDKGGVPYVFHPFHVAEQMKDEQSTCVALLHDVIEDGNVTKKELADAGFPTEIVEAVVVLTKKSREPYMEYIERIKASKNALAVKVKLADLAHNSDLTRLSKVTEYDRKRIAKYENAIKILKAAKHDR